MMSGKKRTFLAIDVSYPKICTYPEYEGKPYYGIKYLEDGETILGFGTYKPEVLSEYLRNYFMSSAEPEERMAKVVKFCHVSKGDIVEYSFVGMCRFCGGLVYRHEKFCSECGAKLDWSGNETDRC